MVLAGLGADVIKVEPPGGSDVRGAEPLVPGLPASLASLRLHAFDHQADDVVLDAAGRSSPFLCTSSVGLADLGALREAGGRPGAGRGGAGPARLRGDRDGEHARSWRQRHVVGAQAAVQLRDDPGGRRRRAGGGDRRAAQRRAAGRPRRADRRAARPGQAAGDGLLGAAARPDDRRQGEGEVAVDGAEHGRADLGGGGRRAGRLVLRTGSADGAGLLRGAGRDGREGEPGRPGRAPGVPGDGGEGAHRTGSGATCTRPATSCSAAERRDGQPC